MIGHWGSGIPRIIGKVKAAGLREPEFIGGEVDLRINIYRGGINDTNRLNRDTNGCNNADKVPDSADKVPDSEQERRIYEYVLENGSVTTNKVMGLLNVKERRARVILQSIIEKMAEKNRCSEKYHGGDGSRCFLYLTLKLVSSAEKSCSGNRLQMDFTIESW